MKMTLLEMVQDILNDLESDEVNSIDDTAEATQVAQIIKSCYMEWMSNREWKHLKRLVQLAHSGTPEHPTHLLIPENIKELTYFAYESTKKENTVEYEMQEVKYLYPDQFLRKVNSRGAHTQNVQTVTDFSGTKFVVATNTAPTYWTSFDDKYIVCDSYNASLDDALKAAKVQAMAVIMPAWDTLDDFVPDLPAEAFAGLLAEAKSTAFFSLKQMVNEKAEAKAARQQRWLSRKNGRAGNKQRYPNYGRRSPK